MLTVRSLTATSRRFLMTTLVFLQSCSPTRLTNMSTILTSRTTKLWQSLIRLSTTLALGTLWSEWSELQKRPNISSRLLVTEWSTTK